MMRRTPCACVTYTNNISNLPLPWNMLGLYPIFHFPKLEPNRIYGEYLGGGGGGGGGGVYGVKADTPTEIKYNMRQYDLEIILELI